VHLERLTEDLASPGRDAQALGQRGAEPDDAIALGAVGVVVQMRPLPTGPVAPGRPAPGE